MKNGYRHETGDYSPETAVGTGANEPLVDEVEAATAVPTVDESTAGQGGNKPRAGKTIANSGQPLAEPTSTDVSNGKDYETREVVEDPHADDDKVNQPAADVRPEAPQAVKPSRVRKTTA